MKKYLTTGKVIFILAVFLPVSLQAKNKKDIDWGKFLSGCDLVTENLGSSWGEGMLTGNGLLGTMIYRDTSNAIRVDIGRTDVRDHQPGGLSPLFAKARLPIGYFLLKPSGKIKSVSARLDLWNAEVKGTIYTDKGSVEFSNITLSESPLIYIKTLAKDNEELRLEWVPLDAVSSRTKYPHFVKIPDNYNYNSKGSLRQAGDISYFQQPLLAGGGYSTAWKQFINGKASEAFITVSYNSQDNKYVDEALQSLSKVNSKSATQYIKQHRSWWHNYYPKSFLTFPDRRIQSFYWIQQYKVASATRKDKPALDLLGPWLTQTPWPAYWFNLNIQLTYSPLYAANRLDIAESLLKAVDNNRENLINNVPQIYREDAAAIGRAAGADFIAPVKLISGEQSATIPAGNAELSNLTWMLYYYWQHYRYSLDKDIAERLFPILKRSVNYALHLLSKNESGQLSFNVKTHSPEYPIDKGTNTNYDLSLLRWGCKTLLELDEELDKKDPLVSTWQNVLNNLIPYPRDENGFRVASDIPFNQSHRHYSHLLMIYPLYDVNWDQVENRALIEKSLTHWLSFSSALQGFSLTGGASMYAAIGKGTEAVGCLDRFLDKFVTPNTMHIESGPVIETPLAAAASMQELYVQYWNKVARIFPAVPKEWADAGFEDMRTDGAFLISAVRKGGITRWVKIKSLQGGQISVKPGLHGMVKMQGTSKSQLITGKEAGNYTCIIPKGHSVILYANKNDLQIKLSDVTTLGENSSFGKPLKKK